MINVEKVAALDPDLILAEWWPLESAYSGMEEATGAKETMLKIAPVAGPAQSTSIVTLIEDYEKLAASLGADVNSPAAAAARPASSTSLANFKSAVAAQAEPFGARGVAHRSTRSTSRHRPGPPNCPTSSAGG